MNKDEKIKKNIGLAFDLLREIINKPEAGNNIPNNATIIFLDKDLVLTEKETNGKKNKFVKVRRKFEFV